MKRDVPVLVFIIPPIVASIALAIGAGIVTYGVNMKNNPELARQLSIISVGSAFILGFLWGAMIWAEKIADVYMPNRRRPMKVYDTVVQSPIRIELRNDNGEGYLDVKYVDLPAEITMKQMVEVGKHVSSNGFVFSHALSGKHMPLNRSQFEVLRDMMIARGLARWNNPKARNQGVTLLPAGKALFKQLAAYQEGRLPKLLQTLG